MKWENLAMTGMVGVCAAYAAIPSTAVAQAVSAPEGAAGSSTADASGGAIEDIVVVAQKRSERLQDVPLAVKAVTADALAQANVSSVQDLGQVVPGLVAVRNFTSGGVFATLRGVGSVVSSAGFENSVAVYLDGVYSSATNGSTLRLNNIQRIEVLKGPQGTLFGRNATGGVINIITRDPSPDFSGNAKVSLDSYETVEATLYATGGLAPDLAIDFGGLYTTQGKPWGHNVATGEDFQKIDYEYLLRSKLLWTPGDTTKVRLIGDYARSKDDLGFYVTVQDSPFQGLFTKPVLDNEYDGNFDGPIGRRFSGGGISAQLEQNIGDLMLVNIFSWRDMNSWTDFDLDQSPQPAQYAELKQYDRQVSNELRLQSSKNGPFSWLVGVYYLRYNSGYDPFIIHNGPIFAPRPTSIASISFHAGQLSKSYAAFGQASLKIGEGTTLTAGLRYSADDVRRYGEQLLTFNNGLTSPGDTAKLPAKADFNKLTWRASIDHRFDDRLMVYASVNRGFKSGGFNPNATNDSVGYKPETLDAYEIGLKSDPIPGKVRLNLAAYYYDFKNPQLQVTIDTVAYTRNAPKAEIYGIDADLSLAPADGLRIDLGAGWNHSRYGTFTNAPFFLGCPAGVAIPCQGDATGNRLSGVPDWTATGSINYEVPLASGGSLEFNGNLTYQSSTPSDPASSYVYPAFAFAKAAITWHLPGDRLSIRAYVDNVTDNRSFRRAGLSSVGGTNGARLNPRTFGASLELTF